ncbi:ATP SYNTHASE SUBUNIT B [Salix koriyanagi]|uniref:ATP SYNTHASE SUBUNIT B n=1 Tax=Salix koriyanagi TaxID=2511006 RepID=A0A9Q0P6P0_9ROSI|nr:ATP SYNTHASE SUBUNIT B [Salix koriyanagi]
MEELKKLEEAQRMITLMESHALLSSSSSNNRFLANLFLLLIQQCGDLDFKDKLSLINQHLPKISDSFLEEASLLFNRKEAVLQTESKFIANSNGDMEDMALVGLDAMQRANSTLEDFCRSYFMFHEMDINKPRSIFKYLPLLSYTESYIYQMDSLNEKIVNMQTNRVGAIERKPHMEVSERWIGKSIDMLKNDPFRPLLDQLQHHGLLTERINEEFRFGEEYWDLERKLCSALMNQTEILVEDVMRAIHLKSFDYRVLNLLLYQLRGEKVNDVHMEFLSISEFLVEVSDDLDNGFFGYCYDLCSKHDQLPNMKNSYGNADDVLENNFNILRMFVRIYGPAMAPAMLAKYIAEAEEKYDSLLKTLDPQLSRNYQRRCEEATTEGGKMSGYPLGTWNIPPAIVDEELYRSNRLNSESVVTLG